MLFDVFFTHLSAMFIGENQQKRGGSKDGFQPDTGISGHPLLVRANNSW